MLKFYFGTHLWCVIGGTDTQRNDINQNNIQHNDIQHKGLIYDTYHK